MLVRSGFAPYNGCRSTSIDRFPEHTSPDSLCRPGSSVQFGCIVDFARYMIAGTSYVTRQQIIKSALLRPGALQSLPIVCTRLPTSRSWCYTTGVTRWGFDLALWQLEAREVDCVCRSNLPWRCPLPALALLQSSATTRWVLASSAKSSV